MESDQLQVVSIVLLCHLIIFLITACPFMLYLLIITFSQWYLLDYLQRQTQCLTSCIFFVYSGSNVSTAQTRGQFFKMATPISTHTMEGNGTMLSTHEYSHEIQTIYKFLLNSNFLVDNLDESLEFHLSTVPFY